MVLMTQPGTTIHLREWFWGEPALIGQECDFGDAALPNI
jgi:hypothetical protein